MEQAQINDIKNSIKNQIETAAKERGLPNTYIQFRIQKKTGFNLNPINVHMYQLNECIKKDVKIGDMFNIPMIQAGLVQKFLNDKVVALAHTNGIDQYTANARIYIDGPNDKGEQDTTPKAALYNNDAFIKTIEIEELVN